MSESDLDTVIPAGPRTIPTRNGDFIVGPITMNKVSRVMKALQPLQHFFKGGWENVDQGLFFELIAEHAEAMQELAAAGIGCDREKIGALLPDDFVEVFMALVQENLDFFIRSVLPKLSEAMALAVAAVKEKMPSQPGQTDSKA